MSPSATLTVVVLPAPLGPSSPNTSLACDLEVHALEDDDLLPAEADVDGLVKIADAQRAGAAVTRRPASWHGEDCGAAAAEPDERERVRPTGV